MFFHTIIPQIIQRTQIGLQLPNQFATKTHLLLKSCKHQISHHFHSAKVYDTGNYTGQPINVNNMFGFGSVPSEVRKNEVKLAPSIEFTTIFVQGRMKFFQAEHK